MTATGDGLLSRRYGSTIFSLADAQFDSELRRKVAHFRKPEANIFLSELPTSYLPFSPLGRLSVGC